MPIGDGTILRAALRGALSGMAGRIGGPLQGMAPAAIPAIVEEVVKTVQADPKMVNATNQEPLRQSGVMWGGGLTTAGAIAVVAQAVDAYPEVGLAGLQWSILAPALIALFGGLFTLVRRVGNWKPLTLFGILGKKG